MFCYSKLWHLLLDKNLKKSDLQKNAGISWSAISKLTNNKKVGTDVLFNICKYLDCELNDIMEIQKTEKIKQVKKKFSSSIDSCYRQLPSYRSIDLFAGIGGIRLGFKEVFKEMITTVFVSEWDKHAQKTYSANFKDDFEIAGDITTINEETIPAFDICLAGFPCQAFSLAGRQMGFDDDYKGVCRGTLFLDVARICEYHKPKVIFCENVKGLTIHDKGRTFRVICKTFSDIGYKVFSKVLNSKNFGVPQNRERIYIVAFRDDIAPHTFAFPTSTDSTKRLKDIIEETPVPSKYYLSTTYLETLIRHKARHAAKGNGFGYEIRDWEDTAGAIVCGGMGQERNLIIDKRQTDLVPTTSIKGTVNTQGIRKMTPREWARLQGFPDTYELPVANVHLYKQFGNSVTINVIKAIAEKIFLVLSGKYKDSGGDLPAFFKEEKQLELFNCDAQHAANE